MSVLQRSEGRSLFWPLMLIGVGLVWLLSNLGVLQPASLGVLFRLWPLVLIIIGLDLLFGRKSPMIGTLIGVGGVALIVILMLVGPSMGWARAADVKEETYSERVGDANAAIVTLDLSVAATNIHALTDSDTLFEADLRYVGNVDFSVSGATEKVINLRQLDETNVSFNFWDWGMFSGEQNLRWNIGLNPNVAIDLSVNSGVSSSTFDLRDLQLMNLSINGGVGSLDLSLPSTETSYDVSIDGGVGAVTIDVPDGIAVRVDASAGVGGIDVPGNYERLSGDEKNFVGDEGVWQTPGYDSATSKITINYDGGVGSFTLR